MFADAIQKVNKYTKAIHSISRVAGLDKVQAGAATLFMINEEGWAFSCKHVVQMLQQAEQINNRYHSLKHNELKNENPIFTLKNGLGNDGELLQLKNSFIDCVDSLTSFDCFLHPEFDLALIHFKGFHRLLTTEFARFKRNLSQIRQGDFLCRLGYPFPEFTNFRYNQTTDDIEWTAEGKKGSPAFPLEGMITRFVGNQHGQIHGIELSTPGLRGQSGGPLFDAKGLICGMQSRTKHLHLGFDLEEKEILSHGKKQKVNDYAFLHLGECVHVSVMKDFMRQHHVKFYES